MPINQKSKHAYQSETRPPGGRGQRALDSECFWHPRPGGRVCGQDAAGPIGVLCSRHVSGLIATRVLSLIDRHADSSHVSSVMASDGAKAAPT